MNEESLRNDVIKYAEEIMAVYGIKTVAITVNWDKDDGTVATCAYKIKFQ